MVLPQTNNTQNIDLIAHRYYLRIVSVRLDRSMVVNRSYLNFVWWLACLFFALPDHEPLTQNKWMCIVNISIMGENGKIHPAVVVNGFKATDS